MFKPQEMTKLDMMHGSVAVSPSDQEKRVRVCPVTVWHWL